MNRNYASINDQPIDGASRDLLKNERYATGLYDFIRRADTPLTIGIQGGWGSGKTSLINLLRSKLGSNPAPMQAVEDGSICLVINAWEHSLFQEDNRAAVAFALLDGIVRSMMRAIRESELFDTATKDRILDTRIPETLRKVGKLVTGLAVFGTNMVTNGLVKEVAEATVGSSSAPQNESIAEQVRELRQNVNCLVAKATRDGLAARRFVIFVDDLDRVHPETAVEILDVLKNILDIPRCVFVLAIDYDVVTKGLRAKFGERGVQNEREFRQYFDKIIQVPFTMPVAAYERQVENLIVGSIGHLTGGVDPDMEHRAALACIAWNVTDGSPRSVKRIINTLSLLQLIQKTREDQEFVDGSVAASAPADGLSAAEGVELVLRFAVVGLQVNFPEAYRELLDKPDFRQWMPRQEGAEATNAPWQQRLAEIYRGQAWGASRLGALIRVFEVIDSGLDSVESPLLGGNGGVALLEEILEATTVTSVGEGGSSASGNGSTSIRDDYVTQVCRAAIDKLRGMKNLPFKIRQDDHSHLYAGRAPTGRGDREYFFEIEGDNLVGASFHFDRQRGRLSFDTSCFLETQARYGFRQTLRLGLETPESPQLIPQGRGLVSSQPILLMVENPVEESATRLAEHMRTLSHALIREVDRILSR